MADRQGDEHGQTATRYLCTSAASCTKLHETWTPQARNESAPESVQQAVHRATDPRLLLPPTETTLQAGPGGNCYSFVSRYAAGPASIWVRDTYCNF